MTDKRIIVSQKRTTNLFDLSNTWKKILNLYLDEYVAVDPGKLFDRPKPLEQSEVEVRVVTDPGHPGPSEHTIDDAYLNYRINYREIPSRRSPSPDRPRVGVDLEALGFSAHSG